MLNPQITRRDFLKLIGSGSLAFALKDLRLDRALADDTLASRLDELDRLTLDGYRGSAHLTEALPRKTDDERRAMRAFIEASLASNTSLAGRDLTAADLRGLDLTGRDLRGALPSDVDVLTREAFMNREVSYWS